MVMYLNTSLDSFGAASLLASVTVATAERSQFLRQYRQVISQLNSTFIIVVVVAAIAVVVIVATSPLRLGCLRPRVSRAEIYLPRAYHDGGGPTSPVFGSKTPPWQICSTRSMSRGCVVNCSIPVAVTSTTYAAAQQSRSVQE